MNKFKVSLYFCHVSIHRQNKCMCQKNVLHAWNKTARSGPVWEHASEQRVAVSTFRWYSKGLRLAIPQAYAWPIPISFRC